MSDVQSQNPTPEVLDHLQTLLNPQGDQQAAQSAVENAIQAAQPVVNTLTSLAESALPVVAAVEPEAGVALAVAVTVVNELHVIESWLGLVPDGQAKQGIQASIEMIKAAVQ